MKTVTGGPGSGSGAADQQRVNKQDAGAEDEPELLADDGKDKIGGMDRDGGGRPQSQADAEQAAALLAPYRDVQIPAERRVNVLVLQLESFTDLEAKGLTGVSPEVYARADSKLSLSKMTFSHQMVRTIFAEQLYRAFTIMRGEPYHHE